MSQRRTSIWATDTAVSQPEAVDPGQPILVDLGGIGFTSGGLAHVLTNVDLEEIFTPHYAPEGYGG